jgi:hypothetical protein
MCKEYDCDCDWFGGQGGVWVTFVEREGVLCLEMCIWSYVYIYIYIYVCVCVCVLVGNNPKVGWVGIQLARIDA